MKKKDTRFDLLDGLRGLAALSVMIYHYAAHTGLALLGGAWVAVDLFFILSGFVIAYSYGGKIQNGMTFKQFVCVRLVRLGPLYMIGLLLGLSAALLLLSKSSSTQFQPGNILTAAIFGIFTVPYFNHAMWSMGSDYIHGSIFPLNDPAWSLFFELFVNIFFFIVLSRCRGFFNTGSVLAAFCVFGVCTVVSRQFNPGWGTDSFIFGFPRVIAEFFLGALIYSLRINDRKFPVLFVVFTVAAAGACFFTHNNKIAFINSITLIPLSIVFCSSIPVSGIAKSICRFLGELSYPLYIVHFPVFRLAMELSNIRSVSPTLQIALIGTVSLVLSAGLIYVDKQIRNLLTHKASKTSMTVAT